MDHPREEALASSGEVGAFRLGEEEIGTPEALGRVDGARAYARISSPHFHAAAMAATPPASADSAPRPLNQRISLGEEAHPLDTGDPAARWGGLLVVMIEHVHEARPGAVRIEAALSPWQNVAWRERTSSRATLILTGGTYI